MGTLKRLLDKHGKPKLNTMTKYPSILTLHQINQKGILIDGITTDITDEQMYATEKIDGTNVRIICAENEYIVGSRETLLHFKGDTFWGSDLGIVDAMYKLEMPYLLTKLPPMYQMFVIYGELYGGNVSSASKNYGKDKLGFRVFDISFYDDFSVLERFTQEQISGWRERESETGITYGQKFFTRKTCEQFFPQFQYVPQIPFDLQANYSHENVLTKLNEYLPKTTVSLSENEFMRPEGVVIRNETRSKILKLRFEDYHKYFKNTNK